MHLHLLELQAQTQVVPTMTDSKLSLKHLSGNQLIRCYGHRAEGVCIRTGKWNARRALGGGREGGRDVPVRGSPGAV